jgi:hypothetical protein
MGDYLEFLQQASGADANNEKDKLEKYLLQPPCGMDVYPLDWWKANESTYPTLALMARDYLAAQATSVACERIFSAGRDLITPTRCRLSQERVSRMMLLKHWWKNHSTE